MQNQEHSFVSNFPTAIREHIDLKDEKFPGAYRLAKLRPETRENVITALMEAGDLPLTQVSASASGQISQIKENLLEMQSKEVQKILHGILVSRMEILRKEENRLREEQVANTPNYEETLRTKGSVTLAKRSTTFHFSSWEANVSMDSLSHWEHDQDTEKHFNFENRPWANRKLLESCPDEIFDTSTMSMSQAIRRDRGMALSFPIYRIELTHETYGPYLNDYYTTLFGAPGILEPLPGLSFTNKADQKIWEQTHDLKIFSTRERERNTRLVLDISEIPELSHIYQKQYTITFDYYDNHSCGW